MCLSSLPIIFLLLSMIFLDDANVFQTVHDSSMLRLFLFLEIFIFILYKISYVIRCQVFSFYHV